MVITFAGALRQALVYCLRLNAEPFSCADSKHHWAALSHGSTDSSCFHQSVNLFSSLIDGCLKYEIRRSIKQAWGPARIWTMTWKLSLRGVKYRAQMQGSTAGQGSFTLDCFKVEKCCMVRWVQICYSCWKSRTRVLRAKEEGDLPACQFKSQHLWWYGGA